MMDSRKYDIEDLMEERRKATNSYRRDHIDKLINTIIRESPLMR